MTHAYNCTMSFATGFSPYFLMYGRHPTLSIDVEFCVTDPCLSNANCKNYVQKLTAQLRGAYKVAAEHSEKEAQHHKEYYDHKFRCMELAPGDLVLVKIQVPDPNHHKTADKWEQSPYKVVSQLENQLLFKV